MVPEKGPSNPRLYNRRIKSFRLHGDHRLTMRTPVKTYPVDYRQMMAQLEPDNDPVLEHGTQFLFTFPQRLCKGNHTPAFGDASRERTILELVVLRACQGVMNIIR